MPCSQISERHALLASHTNPCEPGDGTVYSHPIGFHGHGAGPLIGLWDRQDGVPGRGDVPVRAGVWYSIELQATTPVPEWNGQPVRMALEEEAEPIQEASPSSGAQVRLGRALSRVVDPFIVSSFDRTGFRIHSLTFRAEDLDVDLSGRRCLVTGANSGIGYETALALADLGAEVVMLCRNAERGEEGAERVAAGASHGLERQIDDWGDRLGLRPGPGGTDEERRHGCDRDPRILKTIK